MDKGEEGCPGPTRTGINMLAGNVSNGIVGTARSIGSAVA